MVNNKNISKGYKQTDVGVIPEEWDVKKLDDIGLFSKGQGIKKNQSNSGVLPCIRYGELYTRHHNYIKRYYSFISKAVAASAKQIQYGDILFAGSGETKEEIGKCAAFIERIDAYAGGDVVILSPYNANPIFLGYLLNSQIAVKQKSSKGQGDAIVHISASNLKEIQIPFPSVDDEQKVIATTLIENDALTESLEKLISKKQMIKQGAMQKLLTGKRRLAGFTRKWQNKKLCSFGFFKGGSGFPIKYQGLQEGKYPFYKVSDMNNEGNATFMIDSNNWISESACRTMGANTFPANTVVFAKIGAAIFLERKKILTQESCIDNNMMGFVLNECEANPRFIHYLFLNIKLGKLVSATALPSINGKQIAALVYDFPELSEQTAIASVLSDMDTEIEGLEQKLAKYNKLKQGMLQVLLTGKIRLIRN